MKNFVIFHDEINWASPQAEFDYWIEVHDYLAALLLFSNLPDNFYIGDGKKKDIFLQGGKNKKLQSI